jgi:hypothetical protein
MSHDDSTMCMDPVHTQPRPVMMTYTLWDKYLLLVHDWGTVRETVFIWPFLSIYNHLYKSEVHQNSIAFPCIRYSWSTCLKSLACSLRNTTSLVQTLS